VITGALITSCAICRSMILAKMKRSFILTNKK
jgi:hypothetical protein